MRAISKNVRKAIGLPQAVRAFSTKANGDETSTTIRKIRNIGIAAHIDAGKTTTTERILYYTGNINRVGEVHDGDTITDYMAQERERGITIKAAAVTYNWKDCAVNLIDTPGHVDFTIEVERSFRVLDGAIALYDAVSGTEAQSETVWEQANRYNVARIAFANKMDRDGASYENTAESIRRRLGGNPLLMQVPIGYGGSFAGIVDLLTLNLYSWPDKEGKVVQCVPLSEIAKQKASGVKHVEISGRVDGDGPLIVPAADILDQARIGRETLINAVAEVDESIGEAYLFALDADQDVNFDPTIEGLDKDSLARAIRASVCGDGELLPLFAGSAYKNKGIQLLLDAVNEYLPSPAERPALHAKSLKSKDVLVKPSLNEPLRALVFKVANHPTRGPLAYFRVYSGILSRSMPLQVPGQSSSHRERPSKLLQLFADNQKEVESVAAGHIGAAVGLKTVRTGDTLCVAGDPNPATLPGVRIPQSVFTASMETSGPAETKELEEAMTTLLREDPSLTYTVHPDTGQLLLSGMGELHLDITADRLRREYGISGLTLGKPQVAYRESVSMEGQGTAVYDRMVNGKRQWAQVGLEVVPVPELVNTGTCEFVHCRDFDSSSKDEKLFCKQFDMEANGDTVKEMPVNLADAVIESVNAAFGRGPLIGVPLVGIRVRLVPEETVISSETTPAAIRAAVARAMQETVSNAAPELLEPVMDVVISVPNSSTGDVLNDITAQKRGRVKEVVQGRHFDQDSDADAPTSVRANEKVTIHAEVPLQEMVGYSTSLRSRTAGEGTFSMEFQEYSPVGPQLQNKIISDPWAF